MKIFSALLITYIGFYFNYELNKYLATHLDLHGLGDFTVGFSLATIFAVVLTYGGNASTKRFIPKYMLDKDFAAIAGCLRYYLKNILRLSFWLIVFFLLSLLIVYVFELQELKHSAQAIVLLAPVIAIGMLFGSVLQARHKAWMSLLSDKLIKPGLFLVVCFAWLNWYGSPNLFEIIAIAFFILFSTVFIEIYFLKKVMPFKITSVKPVFFKKEWNEVGFPLLYTALANTLFINIEILSLEIFNAGESEVGAFSLLIFIVSIVWINFSSICSVIIPGISEIENDTVGWQKIYSKGLILILITNLVFGTLIWLFSDEILHTFSPQMLNYRLWLLVILSGACINSILDLTSVFLRFTGHQEIAKQNVNFVLVLALFITPPLVWFYGMPGAVISLVTFNFIRGVNGARLMKKYVGINPLFSF